MTPDDIVAAARECVGTKFRHQGRIVGRGMDCGGVYIHAATRNGLPCIDPRGYGRVPWRNMLEKVMDDQPCLYRVEPLDVTDLRAGDVLLMVFDVEPQHVAIYTGHGLIHAHSSVKQVVEHDMEQTWLSRIVRVYRWRLP